MQTPSNFVKNIREGLKILNEEEKHILFAPQLKLSYILQQQNNTKYISQTLKTNDVIFSFTNCLGLQKDSEYLGLFNHKMLKFHQSGQLRKILKRNVHDIKHDAESPTIVEFKSVILAFAIFLVGIVMSCFILAAEELNCKNMQTYCQDNK